MIGDKKDIKAISKITEALEKRFGEPILMKMSNTKSNVETFSSGRADLDIALGGGYAIGKIIEIYSEEACGKTGLALEAIREIQELGGTAAIVDGEHALNTEYAEQIGVNVKELYISQPSYGEQGFETIRAMIDSAQFDLIVVDSVTALVPKTVIEGETGEAKMAALARLMSQGMSQISGPASKVGVTIIFTNQLRSSLARWGSSKIPTGGNALKYYAYQRLEIKNKGQVKEGEDVIGFKQFIKVTKNKAAAPFKWIENEIIYNSGVDDLIGTVEALVDKGIVKKGGGGWFSYRETNLAQGMKKLRAVFADNPDLLDELKSKL